MEVVTKYGFSFQIVLIALTVVMWVTLVIVAGKISSLNDIKDSFLLMVSSKKVFLINGRLFFKHSLSNPASFILLSLLYSTFGFQDPPASASHQWKKKECGDWVRGTF